MPLPLTQTTKAPKPPTHTKPSQPCRSSSRRSRCVRASVLFCVPVSCVGGRGRARAREGGKALRGREGGELRPQPSALFGWPGFLPSDSTDNVEEACVSVCVFPPVFRHLARSCCCVGEGRQNEEGEVEHKMRMDSLAARVLHPNTTARLPFTHSLTRCAPTGQDHHAGRGAERHDREREAEDPGQGGTRSFCVWILVCPTGFWLLCFIKTDRNHASTNHDETTHPPHAIQTQSTTGHPA